MFSMFQRKNDNSVASDSRFGGKLDDNTELAVLPESEE